MGTKFYELVSILFVAFLCMVMDIASAVSNVQCINSERQALLTLKEGFTSPSFRFSSWMPDEDCCRWRGVRCSNTTGRVISLDLRSNESSLQLQGELKDSLVDLSYLTYLDLSFNDFYQMQIPEFLGSLSNLEYLNLSHANFKGSIPYHIGNISRLVSLDMSGNGYSLKANDLNWLYGLSSLKFLDLGGVDLSSSQNWLDAINMLPSLTELRLFACKLNNLPQSLPFVNFTSLKMLDLSFNNLKGEIPDWLFDIGNSLEYLILKRNNLLYGSISEAFCSMTSLVKLDLSENNLVGPIPTCLGRKNQPGKDSYLRELNLSHNNLNGTLSEVLPYLSKLNVLDVSWNSFVGVVSEAHLLNFSYLRILDFSGNNLSLNVRSDWLPPFQLESIGLHSCQLGPVFPQWLRTQKNFSSIDMAGCRISDVVPDWFWDLPSRIRLVNLSSNSLRGIIPDISSKHKLSAIDCRSNKFSGPLPLLPPHMSTVVLANNSFSGSIFHLCDTIKENNSLKYLDLSQNLLSGQIPDCWTYGKDLIILNLASNNLSGKIPESLGNLVHLNTLRLDDNYLTGVIPSSLMNCTSLFVLDLGENMLSGAIPDWIGGYLSNLMILILRSNSFNGHIPLELCRLESLKILDLSSNHLSGEIPRCMDNLKAMVEEGSVRSYIYDPYSAYTEYSNLIVKRRSGRYASILVYVKLIDLSSNNLTGEIPQGVTRLAGLLFLNLSRNSLMGTIPRNIGDLRFMESLDLSWNRLSCDIPASAIHMVFLSVLDLSHNKLSGPIPNVGQFDYFNATTYLENKNLCGLPLANNCSENASDMDPNCTHENLEGNNISEIAEDEHRFELPSLYISVGLGFIVGFWGIWAPLLIKTSWRHAYFRFINSMIDQIYVLIVVYAARIQRKFHIRKD
ncbi:Receptor-like protein EIX2 [Euphorbia peplus]|nr:Receptor-like protein EIX2 [Euphorbia peplus]